MQTGLPPLLKMEFTEGEVREVAFCDPIEFLRWLYGLGYHAYSSNLRFPWELRDLEVFVLPAKAGPGPARDSANEALESIGAKWEFFTELMLVHDSAPVPRVFGVVGPGGQSPV